MCGIVGYKGNKDAGKILLNCIKNLEYRGYDSVGIATKENNQIYLKKDIGKIAEVDKKLDFSSMPGNLGIAHTRWATNGQVTRENSHPHFDNQENIFVVHNGIIENYQQLKKELQEKGLSFHSETDSEVIPQYISYFISQGKTFKSAVRETLLKLKGSFAIALISKQNDELILARKESPLVIGIKETNKIKEFFAASDVPAFLEYTNKVIYMDDNEYAFISDKVEFFDLITNKKIEKKISEINWNLEQAKKGDFPHFILKEINEQQETIRKAVEQNRILLKNAVDMLKSAFGIFFIGCGTSYHAAVSASYVFSHVSKKHVNVVLGSEFRNYYEFLTDKTVMVAISQSGETADVIDAVKIAKSRGVKIVSIVNVMGSTLTRLADLNIMMNAGPEICVLSTKSYTSQLAILLLLAYSLVDKENEARVLIEQVSKEIKKIIEKSKIIEEISEILKNKKDIFLIGRDLAYPSALEGALKIKEVSYIHAEGFAGGELKHGTIALISSGTPCIAFVTEKTKEMTLSNVSEIKARGGFIIGIGPENNELYDKFIEVNEFGNANPIAMIVPIQLMAYYLAIKRGCDPDKPRNLAKSVTVR